MLKTCKLVSCIQVVLIPCLETSCWIDLNFYSLLGGEWLGFGRVDSRSGNFDFVIFEILVFSAIFNSQRYWLDRAQDMCYMLTSPAMLIRFGGFFGYSS